MITNRIVCRLILAMAAIVAAANVALSSDRMLSEESGSVATASVIEAIVNRLQTRQDAYRKDHDIPIVLGHTDFGRDSRSNVTSFNIISPNLTDEDFDFLGRIHSLQNLTFTKLSVRIS